MEDDKKAVTFSEQLFAHLWYTQNIITENITEQLDSNRAEFIEDVSRAVLVLSSITSPTINKMIESFFCTQDLTRLNVFTFLTTYCFEYYSKNKDIFEAILNTCTFVFKTMLFCHSQGKCEYIDFASFCWSDLFNYNLKIPFYKNGGWEELERYIKINCSVPKDKLDIKEKYIEFLHDINNVLPTLPPLDENHYVSDPESASILGAASNNNAVYSPSSEPIDCSNSAHYINASMCQANINPEEAISAYQLLARLYAHKASKLNGEQLAEELNSPEYIDMQHIYKTLSNFINEGLIEVEASSGRLVPPDAILQQPPLLCCALCHREKSEVDSDLTKSAKQTPTCSQESSRIECQTCETRKRKS